MFSAQGGCIFINVRIGILCAFAEKSILTNKIVYFLLIYNNIIKGLTVYSYNNQQQIEITE